MSTSFTTRVSRINSIPELDDLLIEAIGDYQRKAIIEARLDNLRTAEARRARADARADDLSLHLKLKRALFYTR